MYDVKRMQEIMKANNIKDSDIFNFYGDSFNIESPSDNECECIHKFIKLNYPYVNFSYIMGSSKYPNIFIDPSVILHVMTKKRISIATLNSFIESEFGIKNGFNKIGLGIFPQTHEQCDNMNEYLNSIIDETGNHTATEGTKEAMEEKKIADKEKAIKACAEARTMYISDPDNWVDASEYDQDRIKELITKTGYNESSFIHMVCPSNYILFYRWLNKRASVLSLPRLCIPAMGAALYVNTKYLKGESNRIVVSKIPNFPRDEAKDFVIKRDYLASWDREIIEAMSKSGGIPISIFDRILDGEKIAFNETLVKKIFRKTTLAKIGKDIDEILYSFSNTKLENDNSPIVDDVKETDNIVESVEEPHHEEKPEVVNTEHIHEVFHNPRSMQIDSIVKFLTRTSDKEALSMIQELAANRLEYLTILDKYNYKKQN